MPMTTARFRDFYTVLGITKTATSEEIKGAFRKLARQWHPDRCKKERDSKLDEGALSPTHTKFVEIEEAYRFLMDPALRAWYDKFPVIGHGSRRNCAGTTDDLGRSNYDVKEHPINSTGHSKAKSEGDIKDMKHSCSVQDERHNESKSSPLKSFEHAINTETGTKPLPSPPVNVFPMSHSGEEFFTKTPSVMFSLDKATAVAARQVDSVNVKAAEFIPPKYTGCISTYPPTAENKFETPSINNDSKELPTSPIESFASSSSIPQTLSPSNESQLNDDANNMQDLIQINPKSNKSGASLKSENASIHDDSDNEISPKRMGTPLATTTDTTNGAPSEWIFQLPLSLEELYEGTSHRYRITRNLLSGKKKNILIDINVAPGWKAGTKIRFAGAGNERRNNRPQDIVFIIQELTHAKFKRDGSNLITTISIPLEDALAGSLEISLRGLDGKQIEITTPAAVIKPGEEFIIRDSGMPMRKGGQIIGKGDLIIHWDVVFPERLTPQQIKEMRMILKTPGATEN